MTSNDVHHLYLRALFGLLARDLIRIMASLAVILHAYATCPSFAVGML